MIYQINENTSSSAIIGYQILAGMGVGMSKARILPRPRL